MLPHRNIHKYTWTSPDSKTHNHINYMLKDRWHSSIFDVRSFRGADSDTEDKYYYLRLGRMVIAKLREKLAVSKLETQTSDVERFKANSYTLCRSPAALIHTCHATTLPFSDSAVSFVKVRVVD
jgi:hypothetical protein